MSKFLVPLFLVAVAAIWVAMKFNAATETPQPVAAVTESREFAPEKPGPRAAVLKKRSDNHFWADAKVNRTHVEFMVDTGATSVALTRKDAHRIGYEDDDLDFKWSVNTAGGETRGAYVLIDEIQIGSVRVKEVPALVIESELQQSLLGMSFLSELSSYEVRKTTMIIRE